MTTSMANQQKIQQRGGFITPWSIVSGLVFVVLLGGAVASTASAAQLSFQVAELQREEFALKQRQQYFQEQLAEAQSLTTLQTYAQEQGFTESTRAVATLDLAPALAQLP